MGKMHSQNGSLDWKSSLLTPGSGGKGSKGKMCLECPVMSPWPRTSLGLTASVVPQVWDGGLSLTQSQDVKQSGAWSTLYKGPFPAPSPWLPTGKGPCMVCTLTTILGPGKCVPATHLPRRRRGKPQAAGIVVKSIASGVRLPHVQSASHTV